MFAIRRDAKSKAREASPEWLDHFFFLPEKPCYPLPIHHHLPCTKQNPDPGVFPPWLPSSHKVFKYFIPHIQAVHVKT